MLVLSRKTRQQIRIGNDITVTILLVKGQVVRVGVEAPRDVRVLRAELPVFDEAPATHQSAVAISNQPTRERSRSQQPSAKTSPRRAEEGAARTSPGLLELRRRGSLSSLPRKGARPTTSALGPLFRQH